MAEYDLTPKISTYLDAHLVYPLLQYLSNREIYESKSLIKKELELLKQTDMSDYEAIVYKAYHNTDELPNEYEKMRSERINKIKETSDIVKAIEENLPPDSMQDLPRNEEPMFILEPEKIQILFDAAKVFYEASMYGKAADLLTVVRNLVTMNDAKYLHCCWGILASRILTKEYNKAMDEVDRLKTAIDNQSEEDKSSKAYLIQLQQRTWMLHWSLLVFFSHAHGKEKLVDWFLNNPNHMNAIQTLAPHLLRYLAVCVVLSQDRRRKTQIKDLVNLIQQERYSYQDPITEFLECLYLKFDFDGAQEKLRVCENVLANDFFVNSYSEEFMECARMLMLETFCTIHRCVGIKMLAERVNMTEEEVEAWIIGLIKSKKIEAMIDSEKGLIIMDTQNVSPYEQVIERTRERLYSVGRLYYRINKDARLNNDHILPV